MVTIPRLRRAFGKAYYALRNELAHQQVLDVVDERKEGICELVFDGIHWRLDRSHYLDREIIRNGTFERDSTSLMQCFIRPGMTILDVGANFGWFTLMFSRLVGSTGHVVAFEPTEEYRQRLKAHITMNRVDNVIVEPIGLSDESCNRMIRIGNSSATLAFGEDYIQRTQEQIRLMPLDEWWKYCRPKDVIKEVDLIKIDIDGHEPHFLDGATDVISAFQPFILIEFMQEHLVPTGHTAWELADRLEKFGYTLCSDKTGLPYSSRAQLLKDAGNFAYSCNVWCIPKNKEGSRKQNV